MRLWKQKEDPYAVKHNLSGLVRSKGNLAAWSLKVCFVPAISCTKNKGPRCVSKEWPGFFDQAVMLHLALPSARIPRMSVQEVGMP